MYVFVLSYFVFCVKCSETLLVLVAIVQTVDAGSNVKFLIPNEAAISVTASPEGMENKIRKGADGKET